MRAALIFILIISVEARASIFGEENIALLKLVSGQVIELQKLSEAVGVAKEHRELLLEINQGIERVTSQIDSIETIIQRAKDLDPKAIKRISDITRIINEIKEAKANTEEILNAKLILSDQAIAQSALQSETAYKMGQEMIGTGSNLAMESKNASPGRAAQISASAQSANMLSQGVMLQSISQLTQLQAMQLELQKSQIEREFNTEKSRRYFLSSELQKRGKK